MINRKGAMWVAMFVGVAGCGLRAQAPVEASGAWVREPVPGRTNTAAYLVIRNPTPNEIRIVSAASDAAGAVEMHEMIREGDMMKMSAVKGITVPANGSIELKPGGLHIMLFNLKRPLKAGDEIAITLTTNRGWTIKVPAPVKKGGM